MMLPAQCRAARALLDWSQQQLATAAGVGIVTIRQFEAGVGIPRQATTEVIMNTFESAGIEFVAGNGGGIGVRFRQDVTPLEQFLVFLKTYEMRRLRSKARMVGHLPQFGFAFAYHNLEGADLMYAGGLIGRVRWSNGRIIFDPELPGTEISLMDEVFDLWVSRADYRRTTGL